jgi:L-alanine-DL-glutamate epimerase-like enolase superfamily enzyme
MYLHYEPRTLALETPFSIAHGTSRVRRNVLVRIGNDKLEGVGEAAPVSQHHETQDSVLDYLSCLPPLPDDPFQMVGILSSLPAGSQAAKAAIDIALHDLLGKILGVPLYRLWGLNPDRAPQTSYTIGLGTLEEVRSRAYKAATEFAILKLKLDGDLDRSLALVRAVREVTTARLVADVNCAWTESQAHWVIPHLVELGLEWIEQPLPAEELDGLRRIRKASPLPIFADESVHTARDIPRLVGCVDGVNIKLMKTGGLRAALQAITVARAHDLQVLIGCMVETSVGITAAAHLTPLADWADLDGNLLITNDPYVGARLTCGRLVLPGEPGLGVTPRTDIAGQRTDDRARFSAQDG